ncbi:hypothetical protein [Dongia rigui]|uniref:Uncharacterized protein n=1 Tax=Dongia rigui TaxID=940149 RepID=A0ABU5DV93_9PROT|nr:hypothetical protein [Dongia rigui]MDY0870859.1 hypothetical protein [Dongia rigui]
MRTGGKVIIVLCLIGAAIGARETFGKGLSWSNMDWDESGWTSFGELLDTVDYGVRPSDTSADCREIYRLKDGTPVKIICP